ncbi:MAG: methylated-DNA--[protein]-cysteine S-methyltransferase [Syntrophobacteraceae bacterium]
MISYIVFESPLGWLLVAESSAGIALIDFLGPSCPSKEKCVSAVLREYPGEALNSGPGTGLAEQARIHISEYLKNRTPLPQIPVDIRKGTPFDQRVWRAIGAIPFGKTLSYGQIAQAAGSPRAFRATGRACGRNPVPLLIPCHRVIAGAGKLGGYSGGLDIKKFLLDLEKTV